jgi:hypothetical protein
MHDEGGALDQTDPRWTPRYSCMRSIRTGMHILVCMYHVSVVSYVHTHEYIGVMEAKWAGTRFTPFLVIDPEDDAQPLKRDDEEYIKKVTVYTWHHGHE